jgi:hypothetical protein
LSLHSTKLREKEYTPEKRTIIPDILKLIPSTLVNILFTADPLIPLVQLVVLPHCERAQSDPKGSYVSVKELAHVLLGDRWIGTHVMERNPIHVPWPGWKRGG